MTSRIPAGPSERATGAVTRPCVSDDGANPFAASGQPALEYLADAWQRSVLLLDILRQRGNESSEHEREGMPAVLVFEHELLADGRELSEPVTFTTTCPCAGDVTSTRARSASPARAVHDGADVNAPTESARVQDGSASSTMLNMPNSMSYVAVARRCSMPVAVKRPSPLRVMCTVPSGLASTVRPPTSTGTGWGAGCGEQGVVQPAVSRQRTTRDVRCMRNA